MKVKGSHSSQTNKQKTKKLYSILDLIGYDKEISKIYLGYLCTTYYSITGRPWRYLELINKQKRTECSITFVLIMNYCVFHIFPLAFRDVLQHVLLVRRTNLHNEEEAQQTQKMAEALFVMLSAPSHPSVRIAAVRPKPQPSLKMDVLCCKNFIHGFIKTLIIIIWQN